MTDRQPRRRIAILVGSLRRESINRKLALSTQALLEARFDCEIIPIADLAPYNEDDEGTPSAPYVRFRAQVAAADGVLFCTPEYNRGVPGQLKNAIDVGSRPYGQSVWRGKPAAILSASPGAIGGFGANHQLRQCCVFLDMPVLQQPEGYLGSVSADRFSGDGLLSDGPLKSFVASFVEAFADWVELIGQRSRPAA